MGKAKIIQQTHNVLRHVVLVPVISIMMAAMFMTGFQIYPSIAVVMAVAGFCVMIPVSVAIVVLRCLGAEHDPYGRWDEVKWENVKWRHGNH